ncbi:hypothetical protein C8J56DRAFT_1112019 [Mycena floridula]|nr:hypothetical protein C8J56DRAFT_1112019 [Mycena floridula]
MTSDHFQSVQLKGEIMDLEFTVDTDHRKRRRNRTTQSCLNCHTSKRKCDRKRPCQRCIQLGLTGLCVYEIDDPALRDDPTIDETTRLRNRIAELESLVRELRGKPHPRWAETNFRDGDPNEKWHSRATKCVPIAKRRALSPELVENHTTSNGRGNAVLSTLLSPIKTEAPSEPAPQLYRFSPSPAPSMRYHTFQTEVRGSPGSQFENEQRPSYPVPNSNGSYHPAPSATSGSYNNGPGSAPSSYSDAGTNNYSLSGSDDGRSYSEHYSPSSPATALQCSCRTNAANGHAYSSLQQQLSSTMNSVRQYSHHPSGANCLLYRRMVELHNLLQYRGSDPTPEPTYDSNTPTDSEILTPLSASSTHTSFHSGSPQEWNPMSAASSYNAYFPIAAGADHPIYSHVMT